MHMTAEQRRDRAEQRRSPRRAASVRCLLADGHVDRYTTISDLSATGARVETAGPPAVGAAISVSFELQRPVEAQGRVVWRSEGYRGRGGVIGVAFEHVSSPDALAAFVAG